RSRRAPGDTPFDRRATRRRQARMSRLSQRSDRAPKARRRERRAPRPGSPRVRVHAARSTLGRCCAGALAALRVLFERCAPRRAGHERRDPPRALLARGTQRARLRVCRAAHVLLPDRARPRFAAPPARLARVTALAARLRDPALASAVTPWRARSLPPASHA